MLAIKIASISNKWEYFKSGNFGIGRPFGIVFTMEMFKFCSKLNMYETDVNKMTFNFN